VLLAAAALAATLPRLHSVAAVRSKTFLSSGVEQNCPPAGFAVNVPPPQFVVFTVVRDEQPYIEEFVQYHLFIGVDLIYIYGECILKWPSGALQPGSAA
jgi:hypothetical protein